MRKNALVLLSVLLLLLASSLPLTAQEDEFVFGIVLVGPSTDHGWSQAHYEGGLYVEENVPGTRMLLFESLNPADAPESTLLSVVTEMVSDGAQLIITTSDAFEEDTNTVAEAFPEVVFINTTGSNVLAEEGAPPNVGNYNGQMEWAKAIVGCAAALTTETGTIGYLGPLINPETRRHAASVYLGARYCYENYGGGDPDDLQFVVTWIGFWFNIPGVTLNPTEETNTLFDSGADVVVSGIDTTEALQVAAQRASSGEAVFASPFDYVGACEEAPNACIGVPFYNWGPAYVDLVEAVRDGTWEQAWVWEPPYWEDINDLDLSPIGFAKGGGLSEDDSATLDEFMAEMAAYGSDPANEGTIFLWEGPLNYQDGTELAPEGEFVDALDIWFLPQLLEGMVGASE
jgi:simple sugar transport system substrate-binding protein